MEILPQLIDLVSEWEVYRYEEYRKDNKAPTIQELFTACVQKAAQHMSLIKIAQIIYIEENIKSNISPSYTQTPKGRVPFSTRHEETFHHPLRLYEHRKNISCSTAAKGC